METGYPEWEQEIAEKARQEGIKEGLGRAAALARGEALPEWEQEIADKAEVEARRALLVRMLTLKFGEQPDFAARIEAMEHASLDAVEARILFASSLAELFEGLTWSAE